MPKRMVGPRGSFPLRVLLRLLITLAVLQVGGLSLCAACVSGEQELGCPVGCTDKDEDKGAPCPPLCSTCTCVHARPLSLARAQLGGMLPPPRIAARQLVMPSEQSPQDPEPDPFFRPPRFGRV